MLLLQQNFPNKIKLGSLKDEGQSQLEVLEVKSSIAYSKNLETL